MCYQYPGTKWFIGRDELKRLMTSSYVTFRKVCSHHNIPESDWKLNGQYNYIEFSNGSRIDLLDLSMKPSDPLYERLGSLEYTGGWIEEAGEVNFTAFDVLKTRIGRQMNREYGLIPKMLLTANPKKNWLKRTIWKPWKEGNLPEEYAYIQALYSDNCYTSELYGEQLSSVRDEATRQRLKYGNWDYDDDSACLIDGDAITDIWGNAVEDGERYATVDVARFGKDSTKVYLWKGWKAYRIITWNGQNTAETARKLIQLLHDEGIPFSRTVIDEVGVGGGVVDQMRGVNGFIANSSVLEEKDANNIKVIRNGKRVRQKHRDNFRTLKDQCGFRIAEMINDRKLSISFQPVEASDMIEEELSELKDADPGGDGKKRLVPKDEIRENIGRSPDDLDCIIMRYWFELDWRKLSDGTEKEHQERPRKRRPFDKRSTNTYL